MGPIQDDLLSGLCDGGESTIVGGGGGMGAGIHQHCSSSTHFGNNTACIPVKPAPLN